MQQEENLRGAPMKIITLVATALIILGIIALVYGGVTYSRDRALIKVGPVEARVEERRTIPLPPVLGAVAIAGGILLLVTTRERRTA
jgi:hypothetical protein